MDAQNIPNTDSTALVPAGERVDHQVPRDPRAKREKQTAGKSLVLTPTEADLAEAEAAKAEAKSAKAAEKAAAKDAAEEARRQAESAAQEAERTSQEKRFFERLKSLESQKRGLATDITDLKAQISEAGLDPAMIAMAVKKDQETAELKALREARDLASDQLLLSFG